MTSLNILPNPRISRIRNLCALVLRSPAEAPHGRSISASVFREPYLPGLCPELSRQLAGGHKRLLPAREKIHENLFCCDWSRHFPSKSKDCDLGSSGRSRSLVETQQSGRLHILFRTPSFIVHRVVGIRLLQDWRDSVALDRVSVRADNNIQPVERRKNEEKLVAVRQWLLKSGADGAVWTRLASLGSEEFEVMECRRFGGGRLTNILAFSQLDGAREKRRI